MMINSMNMNMNEPRSTSSSMTGHPIPSLPISKPILPEFKINIDDEEELNDDEEDENHLLNILSKLKEAKKSIDTSKSKKRSREIIENAYQEYKNESKQMILRHNRRWNSKQNEAISKGNMLKMNIKQTSEVSYSILSYHASLYSLILLLLIEI